MQSGQTSQRRTPPAESQGLATSKLKIKLKLGTRYYDSFSDEDIYVVAEPEAMQEVGAEDGVQKSLVVKLSLAPHFLVAFLSKETEAEKVSATAKASRTLHTPPHSELPPHGTLKFLNLPAAFRSKIYKYVVVDVSSVILLQELEGTRSPSSRLEWLFTCKTIYTEARELAFTKIPFYMRPSNNEPVKIHNNGHRIANPFPEPEPWHPGAAVLKEIKFRLGIDHNYFVIDKFEALNGKVGLVKHLSHSMPVTGHAGVEYHQDLDWTPFGMNIACGSYSAKYGTLKLGLEKLTLVTNGFPLDHFNRTSKRDVVEDLAAWVISSVVEQKKLKRLNVLVMDRRYAEKVKDARSPLAQRQVVMNMNAFRFEMQKTLGEVVGRPWLLYVESGEQKWEVGWVAKGGVMYWEVRERIRGGRVVELWFPIRRRFWRWGLTFFEGFHLFSKRSLKSI